MATALHAGTLVLLLCFVRMSAVRAAGFCSDGSASHSLVASANASGYWSATLDLEKDTRMFRSADTVQLDVRPVASLCGEVRIIAMTVELRGSSPVTIITSPTGTAASRLPPPELGYTRAPTFPGFYKVHAERLNWEQAKAACEAEGAHLVLVDSQEEASALVLVIHQLAASLTATLHAGFFATNVAYVTIFDEPMSEEQLRKWAPGEPKHMDICGAIDHAAKLKDAYCSWKVKRSFVCEYGGTPSESRGAPRGVQPTQPTILRPERILDSFQVHSTNASWGEAHAECQRFGGHLAVLQATDEDVARQVFASQPHLPPQLHVGFFAKRRFVTVLGDDLSDSGYQEWAHGEPNNHPCVVVNHNASLSSVGCALKTAFLCTPKK